MTPALSESERLVSRTNDYMCNEMRLNEEAFYGGNDLNLLLRLWANLVLNESSPGKCLMHAGKWRFCVANHLCIVYTLVVCNLFMLQEEKSEN